MKEDLRSCIESKNYAALNDLLDGIGDSPVAGVLKKLPALFGGREVFSQARALFEKVREPALEASLDYLEQVYQLSLIHISSCSERGRWCGRFRRTSSSPP